MPRVRIAIRRAPIRGLNAGYEFGQDAFRQEPVLSMPAQHYLAADIGLTIRGSEKATPMRALSQPSAAAAESYPMLPTTALVCMGEAPEHKLAALRV